MSAPYLDIEELPDSPTLDLVSAIEDAGDALYACQIAAGKLSDHEADWCGAGEIIDRLRAVIAELANVVGA